MKIGRLVLMVFVILVSCSDAKSTTDLADNESKDQEVNITAKAIENFNYTDYALSGKGEEFLANWEKYQEFALQISYLKKADLSFFNGDKKVLKMFIDEFTKTIPVEFRTNPIVSRTVIIETATLKLNESLTIDNIEGQTKLLNVKEVLVAFSNLNYQINKKIERDIYDKISKE
ncbi:hypothetical protein [Winogradskyella sp. PG-2]|uniref:hypothetical protein n=1 Tax=Winogradskyella sp. PG-2 TaxID=754409 RepID=UPI00045897C6|nr:hypothetical protein [Winogradskyella sp. PG-2]BAO75708.1 hypothetical protein WPG_1478 [Winogradskyella sp. PG-2]